MPTLFADAETDTGPRDRDAERLCVATRVVRPVGELIRFVLDPDGTVIPDLKRRLPGRGVWVSATREALDLAVARNAFARGFKKPVRAAADLGELTARLLERAALDALGIANKAGRVVAGFTKVEAALSGGEAAALLQASEAAPDGVRKLAAVARRVSGSENGILPVFMFVGTQLDLALGRSNVIHAALLAGPASEPLLARCRSLEGFLGGEPAKLAESCG